MTCRIFGSGTEIMSDEPEREYYDSGQIRSEEYWGNDEYHRTNGPAYNRWYENGQIKFEVYIVNGNRHREDGPAISCFQADGTVAYQEFWLHDKEVTALDVFGDTPDYMFWVLRNG